MAGGSATRAALALNYPPLQICKGMKLGSWSAHLVRVGYVLQHPASPPVEFVVA